jgi:hypothetical protein
LSAISRKQPSLRISRMKLLALVILLMIAAGVFTFVQQTLVSANGNRFDFYPSLVGARAFWAGENPYDPSITARIQTGMFGEELRADEDQQRVAHPAYTLVLLAPVTLLSNSAAIALWSTLQLFALFATPFIWLIILRWQPRPLTLAALLLGCVFAFRYPMIVFILGQFIGTMVFCLSLAVLLMQRGRHGWAGAVLVGATMPPTLGGVLALALLGSAVARGHWRGVLTFGALMSAILLVTLARLGWWLPQWLGNLRDYTDYANPQWAAGMLPLPLTIALIIGVLAQAGWALWRVRGDAQAALVDFVCIAIVGSLLVLPQTGSYVLTLLIPVLVVAAARISRHTVRGWRWLLWAAVLLSPWLFLSLNAPQLEALAVPLLAGALWWVTRPLQIS